MRTHYKQGYQYQRQTRRDGFQATKCEYCGRDTVLNLSQISASRQVAENCQGCGAPLNLLNIC